MLEHYEASQPPVKDKVLVFTMALALLPNTVYLYGYYAPEAYLISFLVA